MNGVPKTPEEFSIWMVEKVGDIHTKQAEMLTEVRVMATKHEALEARVDVLVSDAKKAVEQVIIATTKHEALKDRVDEVVATAKTAKNWENAKFVTMAAVHAVANVFKVHI